MRSSKPILLAKHESDNIDGFKLSDAGFISTPSDYIKIC